MPDKSPPPLAWSLRAATEAVRFFSLDADVRAAVQSKQGIDEPEGKLTPFSVMDFMTHLSGEGVETSGRRAHDLDALLARMADEGILAHAGNSWSPLFGRRYLLNNAITQAQMAGVLWLAPILGPEVVINVMAPNIAHLTGTKNNGEAHGGSGLLIDTCHVLTAAHVVNDMALDETVQFSGKYEATIEGVVVNDHARDVALLRVSLSPEIAETSIGGLAYRDPQWADSVTIMGYPPVPLTTQAHLTVQTGEVVNPEIETPAARSATHPLTVQTGEVVNPEIETAATLSKSHPLDFLGPVEEERAKVQWFLYSAVARPGTSGGPIIGSDGRVLGLVTREFSEQSGIASPFYAGAPTGSIIDALAEENLEQILPIEYWE